MISSRVKKKKCSELHQSFPALPLASLLYTLLFLSWYLQDSSNEASKKSLFSHLCLSRVGNLGSELCYNVMAAGAARIRTVN